LMLRHGPCTSMTFSRTGQVLFRVLTVFQKSCLKQVGAVTSSPVVGFGRKIYVGSSDGKIYEVTLDGSAPKVIYTTGACIDSTPAVTADGMLYVGSNDGFLYAVVLSTKSLAWKLRLGTAVKSSPIVTSTGKNICCRISKCG